MKHKFEKLPAMLLIIFLLTGIVFPQIQPSFANNIFNPAISYNSATGKWDIKWIPIDGTETYSITWHGPAGALPAYTDEELVFDGVYNIVSLSFLPDHIYDITFSFKDSEGTPVQFTNKYGELTEEETLFFLSKITFQGTSFNDVAVLGGLEDADPDLIQSGGQTIRVISGNDPKVTLRWKVPTIWEPAVGDVLHITNENVDLDRLESGGTSHVDLDYGYFHIRMNEVSDIITERIFTTTVQEGTGDIIVSQSGDPVQGFEPDGSVTAADGFVYFTLDQSDGILPGTEYENVNIKLTFRSGFSEAPYTRLSTAAGNFLIENKDNIFQSIGGQVTSIFTPLWFEASKVDIDKLELKIYKIKSRNYTELYYEVQDAGSIVELLENPAEASSGIKLPDVSIPDTTGWGSVIVEIPIDQNGEHPLRFYRFVVTDGDALTPLGSLAINLQLLGNDTGKPPVPREIEAEPLYNGKQEVLYKNPLVPVPVNIPLSDIRISFEKPLVWMTRPWNEIVSSPDDESDFTFHLLLNTYLSDNVKMMETREIGDEEVSVFVPVKEKRMLSIGKRQLKEDPNDSTRVYFELDGSKLFYDYVRNVPLDYENDIDYDINGNGDYPDFLIPNTTYYLRMFSTRLANHDDVNWALREELEFENDISYISPMISFTTYPTREKPVPLPNLSLDIDFDPEPDPETGKTVMNGIIVEFPKILNDNDWMNYTNLTEGRRIEYDIYISDSTDEDSFILLDPSFLAPLETQYPDENPDAPMSALVTVFPVGSGEELKPNTTYYFMAQAKLYVDGEDEPFISSDMTPIKSITTPKTDSGDLDDLDRDPRTPVEFSIARDSEGELELTDSKVAFNWLHAEKDVTYEMVVTRKKLAPNATANDYKNDPYNVGDESSTGFLEAYKNYIGDGDLELHIDLGGSLLENAGLEYNPETRMARFPINLPFLRPNHLYYFSLRAVRGRGTEDARYSNWVSIPVTTKMVAPPDFFEVVTDVQLGFNIRLRGDIPPENVGIMLKKGYQSGSAYVELSKAKYTVVRDGRTYYIRIYDLDPDTWYDIKPFYKSGEKKYWYDSDDKDWSESEGNPVELKTRNTLNEIEVRFAGEEHYKYFLELRTDDDEGYTTLEYNAKGETDYCYTLEDGTRVEFYLEKTNAYLEEGLEDKYLYYAKISNVRRRKSDGTYARQPLLSNTRYYIKIWAHNIEDSKHIGPVTIRTDFSQSDYDKDHMKDEISDMFETKADGLMRKLYFTVDEKNSAVNRVMLKASRISNLMQVSEYAGVTVDISKEKPEAAIDKILIPYDILKTIQESNSRLTVKLAGCDITVTRDSFDLDALKRLSGSVGVKETMLEITIERKASGTAPVPLGYSYASKVYDVKIVSVSMKRTYSEINEIIYDILKEPEASGPFKYGILDRELARLLEKETNLNYVSYVELDNMIAKVIDIVEEELSMYIKDIIDGGRGFSASAISYKDVPELPGGIKLKIIHSGSGGMAEPYMLTKENPVWREPEGIKAWIFPYVVITAYRPGQYAVFNLPAVNIQTSDGTIDPDFRLLSQKYDLSKVFGTTVLYPGDYVSAENAVLLFETITETGNEVMGLSIPAKINYYKLNEIFPAAVVRQNINRGQAVCLVVEIYCYKTGVPSAMLRPSKRLYINNSDTMPDYLYNRLVIALDLGIETLEPDNTYTADRAETAGDLIEKVISVLDLLGEW